MQGFLFHLGAIVQAEIYRTESRHASSLNRQTGLISRQIAFARHSIPSSRGALLLLVAFPMVDSLFECMGIVARTPIPITPRCFGPINCHVNLKNL